MLRELRGRRKGETGMFLFTRMATPKGAPRDVMAFATEITDVVNSKVETTTTLWQNLFGAPVGTLAWSTLVRNRAQMGQTMMTLMADDDYHRQLERGQEFIRDAIATEDFLARFIFGNPDEPAPEVGWVAEMVSATPAAGRMMDAMAWGPEVAQLVGRIGGTMPSFWTNAYGPVGDVMWMTLYPSMEAVDEAQAKLQTNEEYLNDLSKASDLFVPGSGQRASAMRIH